MVTLYNFWEMYAWNTHASFILQLQNYVIACHLYAAMNRFYNAFILWFMHQVLMRKMRKFDDVLHLFISVCVLNSGLYSYFRYLYNTDAITDALTGESIPVRLFLSPYELTPTYRNINNKFSVKYYLNLVLVDEEDRRYFKQQEITVYRLLPTPWMSVHIRGAQKFYHDRKENRSSILASSLLLWRTKDSDLSWREISLFSCWWCPSWFWPVKHIWWQKPFHVWDTWNCNISIVLIWLLHFKATLDSV
jgi:hypothetical protein